MLPICVVRQGTAFGPEYIDLMASQLGETYLCLTDQHSEFSTPRRYPLKTGLQGWWAKMELFAPWNEHLRPFLFLDLDTFIVGDISEIRRACEDISSTPYAGEGFEMLADFNKGANYGASGVMIIGKKQDHIWDAWQKNPDTSIQGGDQAFLSRFPHGILQAQFPNQIYSYKLDCRQRPKGSIVCFHGKPKPHELGHGDGWAYEHWLKHTGNPASDGSLQDVAAL